MHLLIFGAVCSRDRAEMSYRLFYPDTLYNIFLAPEWVRRNQVLDIRFLCFCIGHEPQFVVVLLPATTKNKEKIKIRNIKNRIKLIARIFVIWQRTVLFLHFLCVCVLFKHTRFCEFSSFNSVSSHTRTAFNPIKLNWHSYLFTLKGYLH